MARIRMTGFLLAMALMPSCNKVESLPETPPPDQGPAMPSDATLRPLYQMAKATPVAAGTAFVVEDKAKKRYMLTAAHIMDPEAKWNQTQSAELRVMGGPVVAKTVDRPVYVGKSFSSASPEVDLVIWPLADGAKVTPLTLASDPKINEWLWALGQESRSTGPQKMYRCKVVGVENGGFVLKQHDRFEIQGFSGGPVVNAQGEVVGSLLGGRSPDVVISGVSGIRARLADAKIELP